MQPKQFNVGDKVTWMQYKRKGGSIDLTTKNGIIVAIDGKTATVKPDRKYARQTRVAIRNLRPAGERTELMEVLDGVLPSRKKDEKDTP